MLELTHDLYLWTKSALDCKEWFWDNDQRLAAQSAVDKYESKFKNKDDLSDLLKELEPFARGMFSGHISEWPQLKPLLAKVYDKLNQIRLNEIQ